MQQRHRRWRDAGWKVPSLEWRVSRHLFWMRTRGKFTCDKCLESWDSDPNAGPYDLRKPEESVEEAPTAPSSHRPNKALSFARLMPRIQELGRWCRCLLNVHSHLFSFAFAAWSRSPKVAFPQLRDFSSKEDSSGLSEDQSSWKRMGHWGDYERGS